MSNYTRLLGSHGNFDQMIRRFGVVTVMNAHFYEGIDYSQPLNFTDIMHQIYGEWGSGPQCLHIGKVDTLKISNITQEGPTKTITGGQYANPLIKFGKTARLEMQNALGNIQLVDALNGGIAEWKSSTVSAVFDGGVPGNMQEPTTAYNMELISLDQFDQLYEYCKNGARKINASLPVHTQQQLTKISSDLMSKFDCGPSIAECPCITIWWEDGSYGFILYKKEDTLYAVTDNFIRGITIYAQGTDPTIAKILLDNEGYVGVHFGSDFNSPKTIVGDTFFLDDKGNEIPVKIIIYQFLPDSLFNLTQDAEGDATVFDMNGDLLMTNVLIPDNAGTGGPEAPSTNWISHGLFYSILDPNYSAF